MTGKPQHERLWPLDLSIGALAAMVMVIAGLKLDPDDPDWTRNAWTYWIGLPVLAIGMGVLLRRVASRYVQKSIQIGLIFSIGVHVMMLVAATGVIIFSRFYPEAVAGNQPRRTPVRKTVPEYVFETTNTSVKTPDWSRPTPTPSASPKVEEVPRPEPIEVEDRPPRPPREVEVVETALEPIEARSLTRSQTESVPRSLEKEAALRERSRSSKTRADVAGATPQSQQVPVETDSAEPSMEANMQESMLRRETMESAPAPKQDPGLAALAPPQSFAQIRLPEPAPLAGGQRRTPDTTPVPPIPNGITRSTRRVVRSRSQSPLIAGAAVRAPDLAVPLAKMEAEADFNMDRPSMATSPQRRNPTSDSIAQGRPNASGPSDSPSLERLMDPRQSLGDSNAFGVPTDRATSQSDFGDLRSETNASRGRSRGRPSVSETLGIAGAVPNIAGLAKSNGRSSGKSSSQKVDDVAALMTLESDRRLAQSTPRSASSVRRASDLSKLPLGGSLKPSLNDLAVARMRRSSASILDQSERIAELGEPVAARPRRQTGVQLEAAGNDIQATQSFARRVRRTRGGMPSAPSAAVGPRTEEAIENGLAYLKKIQNPDGSWSLQGHGSGVMLQSDTAATGLCLLAYQGAGYTHLQHQYADVVGRGIDWMRRNQKSNGDLYVRENRISDQNVALYSHGIAALAMSEAYGMTQDPEVRSVAQNALRFIEETQHQTRGGWRYTPQVTADTSVTGWMMMALKSGQLAGLEVSAGTYRGIDRWLLVAQGSPEGDRYRYNPYAPDTPRQRHGRKPTPTMTAVGMLMRMYSGWRRDRPAMQSAADYLLRYPPQMGTVESPQRDAYYWYYATQVMFHMGGEYWKKWNQNLTPVLIDSQIKGGAEMGSWDPVRPVPDRWSPQAGRLYVTTMNLLNLEVYYRHLPIYEETAN
ncbi:MAG: hypothetical protein AAF664_01270 [Planctomycetota bacterium]